MRDDRYFYVYILASRARTLYIGVTSNLERRVWEHRNHEDGFAARYRCHRLVWFEIYTHPSTAIAREKQLKRWRREKKIALIQSRNLLWADLSANWGKPIQPYCGDGQTADPSTALRSGRDDM